MSRTGIIAGVLWAIVAGLILAAWVVMLAFGERHWMTAALLALTGCALSALAATLHIKTYACRVSRVIRVTAGGRSDHQATLRGM